jgi:outer membrane protein assembly factor BamB
MVKGIIILSILSLSILTLLSESGVQVGGHYNVFQLGIGKVTAFSMYKYPVNDSYLIVAGVEIGHNYYVNVIRLSEYYVKVAYNISQSSPVYVVIICPKYFIVGLADGVVKEYSTSNGSLIWCEKISCEEHSIPAIVEIALSCREVIAEGENFSFNIFALNLSNGRLLWSFTMENTQAEETQGYFNVCGDYVVVGAGNGYSENQEGWVVLLNASNGEKIWLKCYTGVQPVGVPIFACNGKYIVLGVGETNKDYFCCTIYYIHSKICVLCTSSGKTVWSSITYSSTANINIASTKCLIVYVISCSLYIMKDFKLIYNFTLPSIHPAFVCACNNVIAAVSGNKVFVFKCNSLIYNYTFHSRIYGPQINYDGSVILLANSTGLIFITTLQFKYGVKVTFSFKVFGGRPLRPLEILLKFPNGTCKCITAGSYNLPPGTRFKVLCIISSGVRWVSTSCGVISNLLSCSIVYPVYEQYKVNFTYKVIGNYSGELPINVTFYYFGKKITKPVGVYWVDFDSSYNYTKCIKGPNGDVRWITYDGSGFITKPGTVDINYYTQFRVVIIKVTQNSCAQCNYYAVSKKTMWVNDSCKIVLPKLPFWELGIYVGKNHTFYPGCTITVNSPLCLKLYAWPNVNLLIKGLIMLGLLANVKFLIDILRKK